MKALCILLTLCSLSAIAKAPNILLVHLDDEKFAGQDFSEQIPNIKALESKALSLSNFYSVSINETVVELLSGKYPSNVKNVAILGDMQADEPCVAKNLKAEGYATAYIGKWRNSTEIYPSDLGFDSFLGILDNDLKWPYEWQMKAAKAGKLEEAAIKEPNLSLMQGVNIVEMPFSIKKIIPTFTEETVDFIRESKKQDKPFFVYLNYASFYAPELGLKKFFPDSDKGRFAQHYVDVDKSIGKILQILERNDILDKTMIIFIAKSALNPEPMPALTAKNTHADAFYKKSAFVYMPKLFKEQKSLNGVVSTLDMPAFIVDCAKGAGGENSMLGYFLGKHACNDSPILYYGTSKYVFAMRDKNYKFVLEKLNLKVPAQLYDLDKDPKEENDLAKTMPEKATELLRVLRYLDAQQPKVFSPQELGKINAIAKQKELEKEKLIKKSKKDAAEKAKKEAKKKAEKAQKEAQAKAQKEEGASTKNKKKNEGKKNKEEKPENAEVE